ncbi:MAG TPA: choice-of-anchor D domain-containing protein [Verrucomicrobiales bacterium]|nr:choice-of-anchor D domain-containing protein [Verrucomicrobiales bacterium]
MPPLRLIRILCSAAAATSAAGKPGDLDVHFNPAGPVPGMVLSAPEGVDGTIKKLVVLPDGKILAMGAMGVGGGCALARWSPDGVLDTSFGQAGFLQPPLEGYIEAMAIQADGGIVLAGTGTVASVVRLRPDGTRDMSFGPNGKVTLSLPAAGGQAASLAVLSDGKIVVGGSTPDANGWFRPRVWRMLPDGSLDPTFGTAGVATLTVPLQAFLSQIIVQPDGKIVAAGAIGASGALWLGRLQAGGAMDAAFASGGRFIVPSFSLAGSICLALQQDGRIIVAGDRELNSPDWALFAMRFHSDGSPDLTFNGSGRAITNPTPFSEVAGAVAVESDGSVLVAGTSFTGASGAGTVILIRYLTNGVPDPLFGSDGDGISRLRINGSSGAARAMALQPNGGILLGGMAVGASRNDSMLLMRVVDHLPQSLSAEWPAGTALPYGGTVPLGPVVQGDTATPETTLTLRNTGPASLTNLSARLSGPGASHFTLLSTLPASLESGESATLGVRFSPAPEVSSFTATLVIEDGDPETGDSLIFLHGSTLLPVATLALLEEGAPLPENTTVDFGPALAAHPVTKTFTIRNAGNIDLLIQGISLGTAGTPEDFTAGPPETDVVGPGASATFPVTFAPGGQGPRTARLRIASTDTFNLPYEINLAGSLAEAMDAWRLTHFGTAVNGGDAADLSDPDHDGAVNLMEYATLTDPLAPGTGTGEVKMNGNTLEYTFLRPSAAPDDLDYMLEWTASMQQPWVSTSAPLTVLSGDGTRQQVKFSLPVPGLSRGFIRLRVKRK